MIARILKILGALAGAALALAFAAGTVFGAISRQIAALIANSLRAGDPTSPIRSATVGITRRGIQAGVLLTLTALAVLGLVGGGLVFVSGIMPITASSRHWPITAWLLNTGMERSVATHSLAIKAPSLDDPNLAIKGAGHYEIGCRPCHGSPGLAQPRIAHMMTPQPPWLTTHVPNWKREELFYIVKHGVKFTGMPAWAALERDDEIWAMVAFLEKLPSLDEAGYRRLAQGEPRATAPMEQMEGADQAPHVALESCARCHGRDGIARGTGAFPNLAGQRAEYLHNALAAYAVGERHSGIMQPIAVGLDAATTEQLVRHYSGLGVPPPPASREEDAAAVERGREIAHHGIPKQRVPSCVDCHTAEGRRHKPAYPLLAGQHADYLVLQLELFQKGKRGGSSYAHLMHAVAPRLKPEQMRDVALFFESHHPARSSPGGPP